MEKVGCGRDGDETSSLLINIKRERRKAVERESCLRLPSGDYKRRSKGLIVYLSLLLLTVIPLSSSESKEDTFDVS